MAVATEVPIVLVTGASGFIATHLIQQLLVRGKERVRGTVRSLKKEDRVAPLRNLVPNPRYELELVEADLNNEESWVEAARGCSYVYHVASPFPSSTPRDENDIIRPAVNGTRNVLKAVTTVGGVKRVVLTSSIAAITGTEPNASYSESDWAPVNENIGAYQKSKALAEKAAWDFLDDLEEKDRFELAVVNPALVIGPLLSASSKDSTSTAAILKLLNSEVPALVDVTFNIVDVRDVAAAHIAAMETDEAIGNRHILVASTVTMKQMSDIIGGEFKPQGYRIPSFVMPKFGVWVYKAFDPAVRLVYPMIGKVTKYSNERMRNVLGVQPIDLTQSIIDTCYSLIELGVVPKKPGYRGPQAPPTDPAPSTEPTPSTDPVQSTEPAPPTDPTPSTEPAPPTDPTPSTEPAPPTEPTPSTEPVLPTEPTQPNEPVLPMEQNPSQEEMKGSCTNEEEEEAEEASPQSKDEEHKETSVQPQAD